MSNNLTPRKISIQIDGSAEEFIKFIDRVDITEVRKAIEATTSSGEFFKYLSDANNFDQYKHIFKKDNDVEDTIFVMHFSPISKFGEIVNSIEPHSYINHFRDIIFSMNEHKKKLTKTNFDIALTVTHLKDFLNSEAFNREVINQTLMKFLIDDNLFNYNEHADRCMKYFDLDILNNRRVIGRVLETDLIFNLFDESNNNNSHDYFMEFKDNILNKLNFRRLNLEAAKRRVIEYISDKDEDTELKLVLDKFVEVLKPLEIYEVYSRLKDNEKLQKDFIKKFNIDEDIIIKLEKMGATKIK